MPVRANHPSILVVDDEESVRVSLTMHLTDEGFDVLAAADGKSAFALLRGKTFDLVILDWKLPDMSGEEILKYIKDYFPKTKVIVITAYANLMIGSAARRDGVDEFLSKPYQVEDLLFTVEKMVSQ
jgi:DNA-binding NtrC family response regulator